MKKIVLSAAIVLGSLSAFAVTGTELNVNNKLEQVVQDEFAEIEVAKLPQAVSEAVQKDYAGATIDKAYVNDKEEYKLEISKDGASQTLYADKEGNWIEKE